MRILVIALSGIGDTLIATPLIRELREQYPEAEIDALVLWAGSQSLLQGNPHLNQVFQKNLIREGSLKSLPFLRGLRSRHYDASLNVHTQGRIHYRMVARLLGAPIRISHEYECHGWLDRWLVNRTYPQDYTQHSVINNQNLLALLGKPSHLDHPDYELYLTTRETEWARAYAESHQLGNSFTLGVHVGSGGTKNLALKRWPLDHYLSLFRRLLEPAVNIRIVLFGGSEEHQAHARLQSELTDQRLLQPKTEDLRHAAALMPHCHAFLSVDTALMHLAAAMKVPNQLVIEAPTLNPTNMPWKNPCRVIPNPVVNGRNLEYYRYDGKPIKGTTEALLKCMASISVEAVHQAVEEAMTQVES